MLFVFLLGVDLFTKYLFFNFSESLEWLSGIFRIHVVVNKGIALNIFSQFGSNSQNGLILFTGVVLLGFFVYLLRQLYMGLNITPDIFVLAGGLGNLMSRIIFGGVVDFFEISAFGYSSSIFNIADVYISFGLFFILVRAATYESS